MPKTISRFGGFLLILISGGLIAVTASAQPDSEKERTQLDRQINSLIRSIDDIVWSDIRIYKLESDPKNRLVTNMQTEDESDLERLKQIGEVVGPDPVDNFDQLAVSIASSPASPNPTAFRNILAQRLGNLDPEFDIDQAESDRAFGIAKTIIQNRNSRPKNFYLVTSSDPDNPRLIALLGVDLESGRPSLTSFVKVGSRLYDYLTSNNSDSTMYSELKDAVRNNNTDMLTNQMFVLRDMQNVALAERTNARATYINEKEDELVLKFISMGRPVREKWEAADTSSGGGGGDDDPWDFSFDLGEAGGETVQVAEGAAVPGAIEFPNEVVVGTDILAGYYNYEMDKNQLKQIKWGLELLNNFDELNYPSIWGGRMTLNAILRNVKIGAVLPAPRLGGPTVATSGIFDKQQKILGGYGIAFGGDFVAPMLNNSGLFNFHASYTFGESSTEAMTPGVFDIGPAGDTTRRVGGEIAYLIRYVFQGFYSFGFYADNDANHLFRLKLGGAVYGVDTYERQQFFGPGEGADTVPVMMDVGGETRGGVAGKLEYMKGGTDIPYGAGLQYFDGSIQGNVWLQFIVSRGLDLKLEGKYFTPLLRDPRPWESNSLVIPSIEVKYHFGTP